MCFRDLDADLVLIDFWGTWCGPSVQAVPHLVDLQTRMGSRLRVVGIACKQGPREQGKEEVAAAVERLGINYTVLLSGMDGDPCPVQDAFHVEAYPTFILLNRKGEILWREEGVSAATFGQLGKALARQ